MSWFWMLASSKSFKFSCGRDIALSGFRSFIVCPRIGCCGSQKMRLASKAKRKIMASAPRHLDLLRGREKGYDLRSTQLGSALVDACLGKHSGTQCQQQASDIAPNHLHQTKWMSRGQVSPFSLNPLPKIARETDGWWTRFIGTRSGVLAIIPGYQQLHTIHTAILTITIAAVCLMNLVSQEHETCVARWRTMCRTAL